MNRWKPWVAGVIAAGVWGTWVGVIALGDGTFDRLNVLVGCDHVAFYTAARLTLDDRGAEVYDHDAVIAYQAALFPPGRWNALDAFRNPPFYALLYWPTARLPYPVSCAIWSAVALGCLAVGVKLLDPERYWPTLGWSLCFHPVFCTLSFGQNSLLSFGVLALTYRLLAGGHRFAAGLVAGLLWFKPTLLIGLVLWGLLDLRKLWPCALGVIASGVLLVAGSYPLVPEAWAGFVGTLRHNVVFDNFEQWKMHNPRAFWRLLLPGLEPLPGLLTLLCAAVGVYGFYRVWRRNRDEVRVMLGAAVAVTLWASPHTMLYEWAVAVVPGVLWWAARPHQRREWAAVFLVMWFAMITSTELCRVQVWLLERLEWADGPVFQLSGPLMAFAGWRAVRLLDRPPAGPQYA